MIGKIKKNKERVRELLEKFPHLRDSNEKLMATIWREDIQKMYGNIGGGGYYETLRLIADGKLTSWEACTRASRKIQEQNVHLRGSEYRTRKNLAQETRIDIHNA
jgi:hypothetical protein